MKRLAIICLATICLAAFGQRLTRDDAAVKVLEYLKAVDAGTDRRVCGATIAPGLTCRVTKYRGPKGEGREIRIFLNNGNTNALVKIIDQGPEGRGKDYP